jgi:hypothetical protein
MPADCDRTTGAIGATTPGDAVEFALGIPGRQSMRTVAPNLGHFLTPKRHSSTSVSAGAILADRDGEGRAIGSSVQVPGGQPACPIP